MRVSAPRVSVYAVTDQRHRPRSGNRLTKDWLVRWSVDRKEHGRSFKTRVAADDFAAKLRTASNKVLDWDVESGLPSTMIALSSPTVVEVAHLSYAYDKAGLAPNSRRSFAEGLVRFIEASIVASPPPGYTLADLRKILTECVATPGYRPPKAVANWLGRSAPQVSALTRQQLKRIDDKLRLTDKNTPRASTTHQRYRSAGTKALNYAVNEGWIDKFEWPTMPRGVNRRKSTRVLRQEKRSTLRSLPNREQVFALLDALENHQPESRRYRAMTAVGVFAGLRPSEVVVLRVADFAYATDGTASIHVERAWSGSDPMWGNLFEDVGATKTGVGREVLIPACLCDEILRWQRYSGIAAGPLFLECGYPPRNWRRALRTACDAIGIATLTPYGLRHTNATWRLAVGAPLGVVADQLGHTVQSLVNHYVGVMQGSEHTALAKFEEFLRAS